MKKILFVAALCGVFFAANYAAAASVSVTKGGRPVGSGDGDAPAGYIHQFRVTTDTDILSINSVKIEIDAPIYQNSFGSDVNPPNDALIPVFPALRADSYITTPAPDTAIAGGPFGTPDAAFFDTADTGPAQNFLFAQLTTRGKGSFQFVVSVNDGTGGVQDFPFSFFIPEPNTAALGALALVGGLLRRRNG